MNARFQEKEKKKMILASSSLLCKCKKHGDDGNNAKPLGISAGCFLRVLAGRSGRN